MPIFAHAEEAYIFRGLDKITNKENFTYGYTHVLKLSYDKKAVNGNLYLKNGSIIRVSGTKSDEYMNLTFHSKQNYTLKFFRKKGEENISWIAGDNEIKAQFYTPRSGRVTKNYFVLSDFECGSAAENLEVYVSKKADKKILFNKLKENVNLNNISAQYVSIDAKTNRHRTVKGSLSEILVKMYLEGDLTSPNTVQSNVKVETGAEIVAVTELRSMSEVTFADLSRGGCGGSDRALMMLDKSALFVQDKFDENTFVYNMNAGLRRMFSGEIEEEKRIEKPVLTKLRVAPFTTSARFKVVAKSELTRGVNGYWDRFFVNFEPVETLFNKDSEIAINVYVENWSSIRRSSGSKHAPADEWFTTKSESYTDEANVTQTVVTEFVKQKRVSRCEFEAGDYPEINARPKC